MAIYHQQRKEMIQLNLELCKEGFAAIYKNQLVDARLYEDAELFVPEAVEEIIRDCNKELAELDELERLDELSIKQGNINSWAVLRDEVNDIIIKIHQLEKPFDDKIIQLKMKRSGATAKNRILLKDKQKLAFEKCPHISTETTVDFIEGGYLNCGSITTVKTCDYCNKELSREEEDTGHA